MTGDVWDTRKVERFRRAVAQGWNPRVNASGIDSIKLDAAVDLACWFATANDGVREAAAAWVERQLQRSAVLRAALAALDPTAPSGGVGGNWIVCPTLGPEADIERGEFQMRFRMELGRVAGFSDELARATAAALGELLDNVAEHSGSSRSAPARGVVAHQMVPGYAKYVVADLGRGILRSLRTNPRHAGLATEVEALRAVVYEGATSRIGVARGNGVRQVLNSIVELRGMVRIRSVEACVDVTGDTTATRPTFARTAEQPGTFVAVTLARSSCEPPP